jgi:mycoredoxin
MIDANAHPMSIRREKVKSMKMMFAEHADMKILIRNIAILAVVLALGLLAGNGVQRVRAHFDAQQNEPRAGDYSALIAEGGTPVVLFSTATCPYCVKARAYLEQHAIAYRNIDVQSPEGETLFNQYQGSGVPLLLTSGMRLQGYVEPEYDRHVLPLARSFRKG